MKLSQYGKFCTKCGSNVVFEKHRCPVCRTKIRNLLRSTSQSNFQCPNCHDQMQSKDKFCCNCGEQNKAYKPSSSNKNWFVRIIYGILAFFSLP